MSATKLSLYGDALRHLADARLALISDDVESRYALDDAWPGAVAFVLRQAAWRFAVKTVALVQGGALLPGYAYSFAYPTDALRTHAIFVLDSAGRECPFDLRQERLNIAANVAAATLRYISTDFLDPEQVGHPWPEQFAELVSAYLAFAVAERVTGERSASTRMSQLYSSLLPHVVELEALPENLWLASQRDGRFLRVARTMIDEAFWRFAMPPALEVDTVATPGAGFLRSAPFPPDRARTHALYVVAPNGQRRPLDIRERAGNWYTDATSFFAEYVSSTLAMDSTQWPDHYMRAVLRQIQFDEATLRDSEGAPPTYGRDYQVRADTSMKEAMADATDSEADPPDPWLTHQLSGALARGIPVVANAGYWRFALKTVQLTDQEPVPPDGAYPYRFAQPADWLRTHALFVPWDGAEAPFDVREHEGHWSTAREQFMARYVSIAALDPLQWPDPLAKAMLAYLDAGEDDDTGPKEPPQAETRAAAVWQEALAAALEALSEPENPWLAHQLSGRFLEANKLALEKGRWRFAARTVDLTATTDPNAYSDGTPSSSYAYHFLKPGDWVRTLWVYRTIGVAPFMRRYDIEFREEDESLSANCSPITLRYVTRRGFDATQWTALFRDAVMAQCQYTEARGNPKLAAVAAAHLKFFEHACGNAEAEDDANETPAIRSVGRFARARFNPNRYGAYPQDYRWPW